MVDEQGKPKYEALLISSGWIVMTMNDDETYSRICNCAFDDGSETNAELIANALNSHDKLLAALRELIVAVKDRCGVCTTQCYAEPMCLAQQAIAAAEGAER